MLNHNLDFIYKKNFFIYGKSQTSESYNTSSIKRIKTEFFPEGGNLVNNYLNRVAFKATDETETPVDVRGIIMDDNNKPLLKFTSYHDGMGVFDILIETDRKYYAILDGEPTKNKFYLPLPTVNGIALKIVTDSSGGSFEISQQNIDPIFKPDYMIGQIQNHVVFKEYFPQNQNSIKGIIKTEGINSGILQVTVFNKAGIPLAERIIFIDNREYIQPVRLVLDTLDFSMKAKNYFSLLFTDQVQGSFSVAITDADYSLSKMRDENILSSILLSSDLKGGVYNSAWYFSGNRTDSVKIGLDLLMMTNGWRRFKWNELLYADTLQNIDRKDLSFITLKGVIRNRNTRKPFAERSFLVVITTADSANITQEIKTDVLGMFKIDSVLFFNKAGILFFDLSGKDNQAIEVKLTEDSITQSFLLPDIGKWSIPISYSTIKNRELKFDHDRGTILKSKYRVLENVTVKTREKRTIEKLEKKYASPLFQAPSAKTIDLVNTNETIIQSNILDYLQSRVASLVITKLRPFEYQITYRQYPMRTFYLNEQLVNLNELIAVPADQVAMVKVFSNFIGAPLNGYGGVLAVYTKKTSDFEKSTSSEFRPINYQGYSVVKEFYSPEYSDKSIFAQPDNRITLHWMPNIIINGRDVKIPVSFYNNDRTRQFKIVVEGITNDGKITMFEKIVSSNEFK
jgi:hypothetical protein